MAAESAAWLTALGAALIALTGLIGAVVGLIKLRHEVQKVHQLVNQESADGKRYREVLREALVRGGIQVPRDPAVDRTDER